MKAKTSHIILNGQPLSSEEILHLTSDALANPSAPVWEKELFRFLNEWFSDSEFISAQTSGSTGEPKPIELSKWMMRKSAERTLQYFGLQNGNRILSSLPCQYIAGKMMTVRAIVGEMNLITVDPASDFEFLQNESFDFGAMVPNQIYKILEQKNGKEKLQNIHNLLVGGSSIPSELEAQLAQFPNRIVSTYGMTETASHIAIRELSGRNKSEFYRCLSGITVSLNETACLKIDLPELNEPLQTNDIAELQSNTSFQILGRADSVIISGGIKHSPEAIEKKLEGLFNRRLVISSRPDKKLGQKLVLVIEGKPFPTGTIQQEIEKLLPPYERPKSILFLDKFPETHSGKVRRSKI